MKQRKEDIKALEDIAKIAELASLNTGILAKQMLKEQKRLKDITSATFETLPRNKRAIFVKKLREEGYSQEEVGKMVNRSQSAISKYESSYDKYNS